MSLKLSSVGVHIGKVLYCSYVYRYITDRKQSDEALRKCQELGRLRELLSSELVDAVANLCPVELSGMSENGNHPANYIQDKPSSVSG